ncbi:DNA/RNA non-specific endonuclease [Paenibacillus sp. FA6]|uniref:DNA/RNA non-specific endonuclease n=1 Tax=Paenibacillus sp. FA6 TaxID=3413029 RepID=UPI003F65A13B
MGTEIQVNKNQRYTAGYGNIRLVSPYPVQQIQTLDLERRVGEHARLQLKAIIPDEAKDHYIEQTANEETIMIEEIDEQGKLVRILFQGLVQTFAIQTVRGIYQLELEAISYSSLLDIKPRIRSFQNQEMKCSELVQEVLGAYPGSDVIDNATGEHPLGGFTLQYKETDWQFLKRVASRFGAVVMPELAANAPKLWMGLPEGKLHTLPNHLPYTIRRNLGALEEALGSGATQVSAVDFTQYTVESSLWFKLGDNVIFQNHELTVASAVSELRDGELLHQYVLSPEAGIRQNEMINTPLAGASLEGKIINVKKDTVRVHLNTDATQEKSEASWIPYSSVYASKDGSGFHCMPQEGDSVQVYFPSGREEEGIAQSSVRRGGGGAPPSPKMDDPSTKYWGTNFGKEMKFGASDLTLTATEGSLFISLDDANGILIQSDTGISMSGKQDIELTTEKELTIEAQKGLYLLCGESSIVMDGNSDIQATEVKLEGQTKCAVYVEDMEPEPEAPFVSEVEIEEPEPVKKKSFWEKALDVTQVVLDVAGLIPGVGEVADLLNAGIYVARGDYTNAALSAAAAIPFIGWGAAGAKAVSRGISAVKTGQKALKATDRAVDTAKAVRKTSEMVTDVMSSGSMGKVFTNARKMANNLGLSEQVMKLKNVMETLAMKNPKLAKVLSTSTHVATQYSKSLALEQGLQAGMQYEFVGDLVEKLGGDKMRAALTWVSIVAGSKRSVGGGKSKLGITDGGGSSTGGGSGKKDKSKKETEKIKKDTDKTKKEDTSKKDKETTTTKKDDTNKLAKPKSIEPSKSDKDTSTTKKAGGTEESVDKSKNKDQGKSGKESGTEETGKATPTKPPTKVNYGDQYTKDGRKKVLKPNVEYTTPEGYSYRTDSQGRIIDCEGTLKLDPADRNEYAQKTVGKGKGRLEDDDGGHLIGAQFKGSKNIDNLVPQNSQINRSGGKWFEMETEWANALKEVPPKKVAVKIEPIYSGNSLRPDSFKVTYQIGNKRAVSKRILNQSGG